MCEGVRVWVSTRVCEGERDRYCVCVCVFVLRKQTDTHANAEAEKGEGVNKKTEFESQVKVFEFTPKHTQGGMCAQVQSLRRCITVCINAIHTQSQRKWETLIMTSS